MRARARTPRGKPPSSTLPHTQILIALLLVLWLVCLPLRCVMTCCGCGPPPPPAEEGVKPGPDGSAV